MKSFIEYLRESQYIAPAYWIDGKGKIIATDNRHIESVIKHPTYFGETKQSLESTYAKHKEPVSPTLEGSARNEVMLRVLQRGFIRIRENRYKWSVETWLLTPKLEEGLWVWAKHLAATTNHKYDDVFIHQLKTNKMQRTSISKVASGGTIKESVEWMFINVNDLTEYL